MVFYGDPGIKMILIQNISWFRGGRDVKERQER